MLFPSPRLPSWQKDAPLQRSLAVLLPVHNAQSTLSRSVLELLDVVAELTRRFEICIIDDCSTDDTIELADELAACYPQVHAIRHATHRGRLAAIHTGLAHTAGEIVFLSDAGCTLSVDEIHLLWREAVSHKVVLGVAHKSQQSGSGWRSKPPVSRGGFLLIHRQVCGLIGNHLATVEELRNFLETNHLQCKAVEVRDRGLESSRRIHSGRADRAGRVLRLSTDRSAAASGRPPRPNYLERLRDFALGE